MRTARNIISRVLKTEFLTNQEIRTAYIVSEVFEVQFNFVLSKLQPISSLLYFRKSQIFPSRINGKLTRLRNCLVQHSWSYAHSWSRLAESDSNSPTRRPFRVTLISEKINAFRNKNRFGKCSRKYLVFLMKLEKNWHRKFSRSSCSRSRTRKRKTSGRK